MNKKHIEGCLEIITRGIYENTFRESIIATKFINFKLIKLDNNDVIKYIIEIFLEISIIERIEKSFRLEKPWDISYQEEYNYYSIIPPVESICKNHKTIFDRIEINRKFYVIPRYFWLDYVYYSKKCHCITKNDDTDDDDDDDNIFGMILNMALFIMKRI